MNKQKLPIILLIFLLFLSQLASQNVAGENSNIKQTSESFNFKITAETEGDWYMSVDGAGDINNDGFDDFLVGARFNDEGGTNTGQTYLFYGRPNGNWQDFDLSQANASFIGENAYDYSGNQVTGLGDINNDGYDDFSIEAILNSEGGFRAGQSYIFLGSEKAKWSMDTLISNANASFLREEPKDLAHGIYNVGDVNADGFNDFIVAAYANNDGGDHAGQMYLILGSLNTRWKMDISLSNANASFIGDDFDLLGIDASGIGDINNDGFDDFAIGSLQNSCWFCDTVVSSSGPRKVDIILGRPTEEWGMDQLINTANITILGESDSPIHYGASFSWITGAGDMNNDGYDDFAIGGYTNDQAAEDAGMVSIFFGRETDKWSRNYNLSDGEVAYYGEADDAWAGFEIVGVGDVNDDGNDDLLIGTPSKLDIDWESEWVYAKNTTIGKAHLIFGINGIWEVETSLSSADIVYSSGSGGDAFANKVAKLGDINNDGRDDFAISSTIPSEIYGGSSLGFVYIIMDHLSNSDNLIVNTNFETQSTTASGTQSTISVTSNISSSSNNSNSNDSPITIFPTMYIIFILFIFRKRRIL